LARLYITPFLGGVRLARLTPAAIEDCYRTLRVEKGLSGTTVLFVHHLLRTVLRDAVRKNVLSQNPASVEHLAPPRKSAFSPVTWDQEQLRLFFAQARRSNRCVGLYVAAALTGMRLGELLGLRWADVDLVLNEVHVSQKLYRLRGAGRSVLIVGPPKTKHAVRTIPLVGPVVAELRRLQAAQREHRARLGERYDSSMDLVFCSEDGTPLDARNFVRRDLDRTIKLAKLPHIRFHDFRHLCASGLVAAGVDVNTTSKILGHHDASFTLGLYVHDTNAAAMRRDALARLESRLFATATSVSDPEAPDAP